jgi:hypothetical protein
MADKKKVRQSTGPFERETGLLATRRAGPQPAHENEAAATKINNLLLRKATLKQIGPAAS